MILNDVALPEISSDGLEQLAFEIIAYNVSDYYEALCHLTKLIGLKELSTTELQEMSTYRTLYTYSKWFFEQSELAEHILDCFFSKFDITCILRELDKRFIKEYGPETYQQVLQVVEYWNKKSPMKFRYYNTFDRLCRGDSLEDRRREHNRRKAMRYRERVGHKVREYKPRT